MMNKKQLVLLKLCNLEVKNNIITFKHDSLGHIVFDEESKLFTIVIKSHAFKPSDYDLIENFSIDLNHMLGLIYELNMIEEKQKEN